MNMKRGQRNRRLFEIGRHYDLTSRKNDEPEPPILTIGATGEARGKNLYDAAREFSFADLKGDLDSIGELAGGFAWRDGGAERLPAARRGSVALGAAQHAVTPPRRRAR